MSIPPSPVVSVPTPPGGSPPPAPAWSGLTPDAKRERILAAATAVFSTGGLEAPMSDVAQAAGAGVASIYRLFGSKHGLFAALVVRRMEQMEQIALEAEAGAGDRWSALVTMITEQVRRQSPEPFVAEARALVQGDPEVDAAITRMNAVQQRVLAAAHAEGRLRADATVGDLRLLFAATRAARRMEPESWSRMLQLLIDALDTRPRGAA